ncbi:MAG: metallophosphoesterase family protein [Caulobacterales bacterium]
MKFGIVSDIHCNAAALDEALRLMGDIDELLCLGDIVTQYRFSNDVIAILRDRKAITVLGNHDVDYLKYVAARDIERGKADPEMIDWLKNQSERIDLDPGGKQLIMVHATPWTHDYVYPNSPQMKRFAEIEADFVLGGHTHTPFSGRIGRPLVVNPGSTGDGSQITGEHVLTCAVLDTADDSVRMLHFRDPANG